MQVDDDRPGSGVVAVSPVRDGPHGARSAWPPPGPPTAKAIREITGLEGAGLEWEWSRRRIQLIDGRSLDRNATPAVPWDIAE